MDADRRADPLSGKRHLVLWDGECTVCARAVRWAESRDRGSLKFVPYQRAPSPPMTPSLRAACARAVHVVTADDRTLHAGRATLFVLREIGWRRSSAILSVRPFIWMTELVYHLIARNRSLLSRPRRVDGSLDSMTHEQIVDYNWDDGLDPIRPVVDSPDTELATALLIYWRLEGPYMTASKPDDATRMNATVRERILSGYYRRGELRYDPIEDNRLSRTQVYKLEKDGTPPVLLGRTDG